MHVRDIQEALAFCTETLGFEVLHRRGNYAYVVREKVGFRLLEETGEDAAPAGNRRFGYYIDVAMSTGSGGGSQDDVSPLRQRAGMWASRTEPCAAGRHDRLRWQGMS